MKEIKGNKISQLQHISNQQLLEELADRMNREVIVWDDLLKKTKSSTLLKELAKRIKEEDIRFRYDSLSLVVGSIVGLWDKTYRLDFDELEKYLGWKKTENKLRRINE